VATRGSLGLWADDTPDHAAEAQGVDHEPALVEAAQKLAGVPVRLGSGTDLGALGLPAGQFDRVVCVDAAYHLRPRSAFLQQAAALLRPGGRLALPTCRCSRLTTQCSVALPALCGNRAASSAHSN
jgi:2-polyprenyl-3-methyl-5-hydroxy-6-metoxy-1,4-benzoquinol methylase